jgi:F0F1-type ATP synthase delta subunit
VQKKYPDRVINVKEAVNDNILGGFQVKIGSNLIDASLKNQLEKIKKECIASIN